MKTKTPRLLIVFLMVFLMSGCATVNPSQYSDNYTQMKESEYLEKFYADQNFNPRAYDEAVVILDKANLNSTGEVSVDEMQNYLISELNHQLRNSGIFKVVTDNPEEIDKEEKKVLLCRVILSELNPGSRMARWWFGEFGAGHSKVQVEGKFIDEKTKQEMFSFADRRTGGAVLDITGGDPDALLREDIRNIVKGVLKILNRLPSQ